MKGIIKKEFAGKLRGFAFNMNTWEICEDLLDLPITDILSSLSGKVQLKTMRIMLYAALKSYADMHNEECEFTEKSVGYHFNVGDPVFTDIMSCMVNSNETPKPLPIGEGKKKSGSKI